MVWDGSFAAVHRFEHLVGFDDGYKSILCPHRFAKEILPSATVRGFAAGFVPESGNPWIEGSLSQTDGFLVFVNAANLPSRFPAAIDEEGAGTPTLRRSGF